MKKDMQNSMICGVCSGIAKTTGLDIVVVRSAFMIGTIFGFVLPFIVYGVLAITMPEN